MDFAEWYEASQGGRVFASESDAKSFGRQCWNESPRHQWRPIESAPKDGTLIDLWAKCWTSHNDKWMYQRFPNCYWCDHKFIDNAKPEWVNLNKEWFPTHWMPIPEPPEE